MELLFKIFICLLAGAGAGIGIGFVGMTGTAIIGPLLMTFLNITPYQAIGVGLACDVFASAISAYTYYKNKNLDIKKSMPLLITVMIATIIGSYIGSLFPPRTMGGIMHFIMIFIGISFLFKKPKTDNIEKKDINPKKNMIKLILAGAFVGLMCGLAGAGGGIMIFMVLTSLLGYKMHIAVGTSVFIMTFTALTGCISHFKIGGIPDITSLILCIIFTLIFARIASLIANKTDEKILNKVVGIVLLIMGIAIWIVNI